MSEVTINDNSVSVRVNVSTGAVIADTTPTVRVENTDQKVIIRPNENAVLVINQSVTAQGPAFQNLFIGFPSSFPAVTHASLLLRTGQFADPNILEPWVLIDDGA